MPRRTKTFGGLLEGHWLGAKVTTEWSYQSTNSDHALRVKRKATVEVNREAHSA